MLYRFNGEKAAIFLFSLLCFVFTWSVPVSACKNSLAQGGFFCKDGAYFCTNDYQRQFGTKCSECGEYVEGEVVTALGNTYHQRCFTCARCRWVSTPRFKKKKTFLTFTYIFFPQTIYLSFQTSVSLGRTSYLYGKGSIMSTVCTNSHKRYPISS